MIYFNIALINGSCDIDTTNWSQVKSCAFPWAVKLWHQTYHSIVLSNLSLFTVSYSTQNKWFQLMSYGPSHWWFVTHNSTQDKAEISYFNFWSSDRYRCFHISWQLLVGDILTWYPLLCYNMDERMKNWPSHLNFNWKDISKKDWYIAYHMGSLPSWVHKYLCDTCNIRHLPDPYMQNLPQNYPVIIHGDRDWTGGSQYKYIFLPV